MKKTLLTLLFMASVAGAMGQTKAVKEAFSEAKAATPNFTTAEKNINEALKNPETMNEAKTWYVAGFIDQRVFETERNKQLLQKTPDEVLMYTSLYDMYNYYVKAAELDQLPNAKGKVKPAYLKDIKKQFTELRNDYINGGAYFFDQKAYQEAYNLFTVYLEIPTLDFMEDPKAVVDPSVVDSTALQIGYYAAVASTRIEGDSEIAIATLTNFKDKGYYTNDIYQLLVIEYEELKDTANLIATYKEGAQVLPDEPFYIQNLINLYIYTGRTDDAIAYLDEALEQDPTNAQYMNVKGSLYEEAGNLELAMEMFQGALKLDPNNTDALVSVGRQYFNAAVYANDEVSNIMNDAEYKAKKESDVLPKFREALPYFEKAHEIDPENRETMVALRNIYYNLGDGEKMTEIETKMSM